MDSGVPNTSSLPPLGMTRCLARAIPRCGSRGDGVHQPVSSESPRSPHPTSILRVLPNLPTLGECLCLVYPVITLDASRKSDDILFQVFDFIIRQGSDLRIAEDAPLVQLLCQGRTDTADCRQIALLLRAVGDGLDAAFAAFFVSFAFSGISAAAGLVSGFSSITAAGRGAAGGTSVSARTDDGCF